jgi:Helix-turn-helix domain
MQAASGRAEHPKGSPLRIALPNHLRPRREKIFGEGPRVPLDREAKVRIMHLARALKHKTEPGKHYGVLTGKFVDVLHAMLWLIHDGRSGQCNPSYATIADKAGCAMSTVCEAIKALELAGILSWVNRIVRVRIRERDLFGQWATTWRVLRTSNAYVFRDPKAAERSKTEIRSAPLDPIKTLPVAAAYPPPARPLLDPGNLLDHALMSLGRAAGFLDNPTDSGVP